MVINYLRSDILDEVAFLDIFGIGFKRFTKKWFGKKFMMGRSIFNVITIDANISAEINGPPICISSFPYFQDRAHDIDRTTY